MHDSYDAALAKTATRTRTDPRMQALIADMMTPAGHPASAPKPVVPPVQPVEGPGFFKGPRRTVTGSIRDEVNTRLVTQGHTPPGFFEEAYRALAGGLRDAAQQSVELVNTATHGIKERMHETPFGRVGSPASPTPKAPKLPEVEENGTVPGQYARTMVSLAAPLGAVAKTAGIKSAVLNARRMAGVLLRSPLGPLGATGVIAAGHDAAVERDERRRAAEEGRRQQAEQSMHELYGDYP